MLYGEIWEPADDLMYEKSYHTECMQMASLLYGRACVFLGYQPESKPFSQWLQVNNFSAVCVCLCLLSSIDVGKALLQSMHTNDLSPVWESFCVFKALA